MMPYDGWISPTPMPETAGAWEFLNAGGAAFGTVAPTNSYWPTLYQQSHSIGVGQAYQEIFAKAQAGSSFNAYELAASALWRASVAALPAGAALSQDISASLGEMNDARAGFFDTLTGGLTRHLRDLIGWLNVNLLNSVGLGWLGNITAFFLTGATTSVNYQSGAYRAGTNAGQIANVALTIFPPTAAAAYALTAIHTAAGLWNAVDAFRSGDYVNGIAAVVGIGLSVSRLVSPCFTGTTLTKLATSEIGVIGAWAQRGLLVYGTVSGAVAAVGHFANGDYAGGLLALGQAAADVYSATRSCFSRNTMLWTPLGLRRIDSFRPGDKLWSRDEYDVNGEIVEKEVEAVFVRAAMLWHLHIAGSVIRTTAEHPFWVKDKGWRATSELRPGDLLATNCGWIAVDEVSETGEYETVYNLRVQDFHTYFVGTEEWGFSVWAHNADYSGVPDGRNVNTGKNYTTVQKQRLYEENRKQNGGVLRSDTTGEVLVRPQKSQSGVTPPPNEAQIDHYYPRSQGGPNSNGNAQVISRTENRAKSDAIP